MMNPFNGVETKPNWNIIINKKKKQTNERSKQKKQQNKHMWSEKLCTCAKLFAYFILLCLMPGLMQFKWYTIARDHGLWNLVGIPYTRKWKLNFIFDKCFRSQCRLHIRTFAQFAKFKELFNSNNPESDNRKKKKKNKRNTQRKRQKCKTRCETF